LRTANQARMSCAAPIGSGTVDLALKPHASFHVLMPEATPMKPPITSHTTNTIVARMSARPEATDAEFRRRWKARGLSRLGCPSMEKAWHRVRSSAESDVGQRCGPRRSPVRSLWRNPARGRIAARNGGTARGYQGTFAVSALQQPSRSGPTCSRPGRIFIHHNSGPETRASAAGSTSEGRCSTEREPSRGPWAGPVVSGPARSPGPGSSSACADGFHRKPGNEVEPSLHPPGERVISGKACGLDTDETGQIPASDLHRPYVGLAEHLLTALSRPGPSAPCP
jgi:hypothetical protein